MYDELVHEETRDGFDIRLFLEPEDTARRNQKRGRLPTFAA